MKKIIILSLVFLLCGCDKLTYEQTKYNNCIKELQNVSTSSDDIPFSISINLDRLTEEEVMYQVIIDNPSLKARDVEAIVVNDMNTDGVFPNIGIFDSNPINLNTEKMDDSSKGVVLVGYIPYTEDVNNLDVTFKLKIKYVNEAIEEKVVYYVQTV